MQLCTMYYITLHHVTSHYITLHHVIDVDKDVTILIHMKSASHIVMYIFMTDYLFTAATIRSSMLKSALSLSFFFFFFFVLCLM